MRPKSLLTSRRLRLVPAVLWAFWVFIASIADPGSGALPPTGPLGLVGVDKWLHVGSYATLAFLLAAGLAARKVRPLAIAAVVAIAYGIGIEAVQYPLAARSADLADGVANALGALGGVGAWTALAAVTGVGIDSPSETLDGEGRT